MKKSMSIQFRSYDMIVDAKSFLGIFSLDLSRPLMLHAVTDDARAFDVFSRYQA